jgi:hypothetical protein
MNQVVRRMMEIAGIPVSKLRRVRIGPLSLAGIPRGAHRDLSLGELTSLRQSLHMDRGDAATMTSMVRASSEGKVPRTPGSGSKRAEKA